MFGLVRGPDERIDEAVEGFVNSDLNIQITASNSETDTTGQLIFRDTVANAPRRFIRLRVMLAP